jgi:flagellar motor switch protein FliN/FliY
MSDTDSTTDPADSAAPTGSTVDPAGTSGTALDEQFDPSAGTNGGATAESDLRRLSEVPMELSVEIGRTHMTVGETLDLRVGSIVALERQAGEAAELLVNGTPIARGEVVVVDEQYGLRVTEILEGNDIACSPGPGESVAVEVATSES